LQHWQWVSMVQKSLTLSFLTWHLKILVKNSKFFAIKFQTL